VIDDLDEQNEIRMADPFQNGNLAFGRRRVVPVRGRLFLDDFHGEADRLAVHRRHAIFDAAERALADGIFQVHVQHRPVCRPGRFLLQIFKKCTVRIYTNGSSSRARLTLENRAAGSTILCQRDDDIRVT